MNPTFPKIKEYKGGDIDGHVIVSFKKDGVQCTLNENNEVVSRKGKPLYNIPPEFLEKNVFYEVFCGDFDSTSSLVRTKVGNRLVEKEELYQIFPYPIDPRLTLHESSTGISEDTIKDLFEKSLERGYEGLIIKQDDMYFKLKEKDTFDVKVIGIIEGKGRNKGRLGAFITEKGNVGTGLTDEQRIKFFSKKYIGTTIEVSCMSLTKDGKFRLPRFERERFDK